MAGKDGGKEAFALVAKAEKKLSGWGLFGNKFEDAADMFEQAANQFKLAKLWNEAGETFRKLSDCHVKLQSKHEAASALVEAGKCYQKTDQTQAARAFHMAANLYMEMGRISMAARHLSDIAKIYETAGDKANAEVFYRQAADLFKGEEQKSDYNRCMLSVAQFSAEGERYLDAAQIYEDVARQAAENHLLRFSCKQYLQAAGLCRLAQGDLSTLQDAMKTYYDIDVTFGGSREAKFIEDLLAACLEGDEDKFTQVVSEYDSLSRLDAWKTTMLVRVKRKLQGGAAAAAGAAGAPQPVVVEGDDLT